MFRQLLKLPLFWAIFVLKLALIVLFSSDYESQLFQPFIELYLQNGGNPWQQAWSYNLPVEFPYHPMMLWVIAVAYAPFYFLGSLLELSWIKQLGFQMGSLGADLLILAVLGRLFPLRLREVVLFYFASPILLYAIYMHGQLDLIPTAFLLVATYLLKKRAVLKAGFFMALAMGTKIHTIVALPFLLIYLWKNVSFRQLGQFALTLAGTLLLIEAPFICSDGFQSMVIFNAKQFLWHDVVLSIGERQIYLPILALSTVIAYFVSFRRCNFEFLMAFLGSAFSILVVLIQPEPAWYVWMIPFWVLIIVNNHVSQPHLNGLYIGVTALYLLYFMGFHQSDYVDLLFLGEPILKKSQNLELINTIYTLLETGIVLSIFMLFQYGIRSNALYHRQEALVIGISGDSGVGKTHLLQTLKKTFGEKLVELEGDGEHKWERGDANWDLLTHLDPKANALHQQADYIRSLKYGQTIHRRDYDHDTGRFTQPKKIKSQDWIVFSGLHTFYLPKMRKITDLKVYMDTDESLRQHWKIIRDSKKRGKSIKDVIKSIKKREKDAEKFVHPQKKFADVLISYFPINEIIVGDPKAVVDLGLKVTLNANLPLEKLVEYCSQEGESVQWDYSDDLETQTLTFNKPISAELLLVFLRREIPSSSEFIEEDVFFDEGYDGVLMCLLLWAITATLQSDKK